MQSRRQFMTTGSLAGLGLLAGCSRGSDGGVGGAEPAWRPYSSAGAPDDEEFWSHVRSAYDLEPGVVNLNYGLSPAPRVVQRALLEELAEVNRAPLFHMRDATFDQMHAPEGRSEAARVAAARALGCGPEEVAITRNGAEALEIAQLGIPLAPGDQVLTTREDYWSTWNTWQQRVARDGIVYREVDFGGPYPAPEEIVARFEAAITPRTRVLLFCHLTWRTGHVHPVRALCDMARERGIQTIVDGAHAFGHLPFAVSDLGCDYYGTSGHKWLSAPLGTGLLYVRRDRIAGLWPPATSYLADRRGGGDIRKLEMIGSRPPAPHNAIREAVQFLEAVGVERKAKRFHYLKTRWAERLGRHERVRLVTDLRPGRSYGIASFHVEGIDSAEIANRLLDEHRIFVGGPSENSWSGPPLVRVAPNVFTAAEEVDAFVKAVKDVAGL